MGNVLGSVFGGGDEGEYVDGEAPESREFVTSNSYSDGKILMEDDDYPPSMDMVEMLNQTTNQTCIFMFNRTIKMCVHSECQLSDK